MKQKNNPTRNFVIGNDAGDADSCISAICLAFIEGKTPIVSISRDTFLYERPEVEMLLDLAGIPNPTSNLLFIEDLKLILDSSKDDEVRRLTLVDHNTINESLQNFRNILDVVEIVDHHTDEKLYTDTCAEKRRNIAFDNGKALVASTTTLVAEMLLEQTNNPPPSLSTLLLGVILLDSVNLDESIGKVTSRDRYAVSHLLSQTDWSSSGALRAYLKPGGGKLAIDTNQLFSHLEHAKYSPEFWEAFSVDRALGYDYKDFLYGRKDANQRFVISTILMPGVHFMEKEGFLSKTAEFMRSEEVTFLGIMMAFYDETTGHFRRQLAFCSSGELGVKGDDLIASKMYKDLELKEVVSQHNDEIQVQLYDQLNITYSRKQIGPMLVDFFASVLNNYT
jgi:exopolyphosphatase